MPRLDTKEVERQLRPRGEYFDADQSSFDIEVEVDHPTDINRVARDAFRDPRGFRPIHSAVSDNRFGPDFEESDGISIAAIAALIELGADIDAPFPDTGWRPIHTAATQGRTVAVQLFLAAGVDPHAPTPDGHTALDLAVEAVAALSTPLDRDDAQEQRFLDNYTQRFGRAHALESLASLNEALQSDRADRLPNARNCVTLLQST